MVLGKGNLHGHVWLPDRQTLSGRHERLPLYGRQSRRSQLEKAGLSHVTIVRCDCREGGRESSHDTLGLSQSWPVPRALLPS